MTAVEHAPQRFGIATRVTSLQAQLDTIANELERAARLPDGIEKYTRLVDLHHHESRCWKRYFELTNKPMVWQASLRASEYAAYLARGWQTRLAAALHDSERLVPGEQAVA